MNVDVQSSFPDINSTIDWVGMDNIAVPIKVQTSATSSATVQSNVNIYASLDDEYAKGIHMSRLYSLLQESSMEILSISSLEQLMNMAIDSQKGLSYATSIRFAFNLTLNKSSLLSMKTGYQSYPVVIKAMKNQSSVKYFLELTIPYSSTCPCSASLSRELYAAAIEKRFSEGKIDKQELIEWAQSPEASIATPHSQRSHAHFKLQLDSTDLPHLGDLIFSLEDVISTAVQTAVKRIDEQEFAKRNAENLIFCEDAARRFQKHLNTLDFVADYECKVEHLESLHAHNAIAIVTKGNKKL